MPNSITYPTDTFGQVTGLTNAFIQSEVENKRNSNLDHQIFTTVNTQLEGVTGAIYHVNRIVPAGEAEDVAEGAGNTKLVSVGIEQVDYKVKTAQAHFQYTDERLRDNPDEVAAGVSYLGTTLFNKTNTEVVAELAKATQKQTSKALDFDAIVDAQALLDLDTTTTVGVEEGEADAGEQTLGSQTMLLVGKAQRAAIRKACKDELQYVESFIRTGYVGTIAGTNIYYSKLMDSTTYAKMAFLFTSQAVTTFIKSAAEVETVSKGNRDADAANKRMNDVFARQSYVVALTDATKVAAITIGTTTGA